MKLEQASKVKSWMPPQPLNQGGRVSSKEETDKHLFGAVLHQNPLCCRNSEPASIAWQVIAK